MVTGVAVKAVYSLPNYIKERRQGQVARRRSQKTHSFTGYLIQVANYVIGLTTSTMKVRSTH